jgi:hypothetical protein
VPNRNLYRAAELGALDSAIHKDLSLLKEWMLARDAEWAAVLGADSAGNLVQQALAVICLCEFGKGLRWSLRFYQDACSHLTSRATVRNEIYSMVGRHLLLVGSVPEDRRVTLVSPTVLIVSLISDAVPRLRTTLETLLIVRSAMPLE